MRGLGEASNTPLAASTCVLCSGTNGIAVLSSLAEFLNLGTVDTSDHLWRAVSYTGQQHSYPLYASTPFLPSSDTPKCLHIAKYTLRDKSHAWGEDH